VSLQGTRGFTLVELMVALAVAMLIVGGALRVFMTGRRTLNVTESQAQIRAAAGFALAALEWDLRMASSWGLSADTDGIEGRLGSAAPLDAEPAGSCGDAWATDLARFVDGNNNGYALDCRPYQRQASPASDTLIVRRVDGEAVASPRSGRFYIRSGLAGAGRLFVAPDPSAAPAAPTEIHELVVNAYYVSPTSSLSTTEQAVPSLRMKRLTGGPAGPRVIDEEVAPGVEGLQIELGIDRDPPGSPGRGSVDAWVPPDAPALSAVPPGRPVPVIAVRVWLRVRAERRETGFLDDAVYDESDLDPWIPQDAYRRELVSTTVYLRNGH
jgi:type IV pilus assembly protein PilW